MSGQVKLRDFLPPSWRYGWKYRLVAGSVMTGWGALSSMCVYVMFFKPLDTEDNAPVNPKSYQYVYDASGRPIDIVHKRLRNAAERARENSERFSK